MANIRWPSGPSRAGPRLVSHAPYRHSDQDEEPDFQENEETHPPLHSSQMHISRPHVGGGLKSWGLCHGW